MTTPRPPDRDRFTTLAEFWPFYLSEHARAGTRALHFIGTTGALLWIVVAAVRRDPRLLAVAVVNGYALAWCGHFFIEKNRPATFRYPVKSLVCDWLMYGCILTGQIDKQLRKHGVSHT